MRSLFSASGSGGRVRILTVAVFLTHSLSRKGALQGHSVFSGCSFSYICSQALISRIIIPQSCVPKDVFILTHSSGECVILWQRGLHRCGCVNGHGKGGPLGLAEWTEQCKHGIPAKRE